MGGMRSQDREVAWRFLAPQRDESLAPTAIALVDTRGVKVCLKVGETAQNPEFPRVTDQKLRKFFS